jgi:glycosyltransferase involved in cell wall biosynthesis
MTRLPLTVVRAPSSVPFGAALNRGVDAASGRIVTKFDDDDFYAPEHVTDVVQALGYSGATLAGKHSMFVYLADVNMLIRRVAHLCESYSRLISGATLTIAREDLIAIGGFRSIQRAVDQQLKDDVEAHGGRIYRGHGYGFVLNRHGVGHTWTVDSAYFLKDARSSWPGCALEVAGVATPAADDSAPGMRSRTGNVSAR